MGEKCVVEFYYDFISPYSYIAFELLMRCRQRWSNMDLRLKPTRVRDVISMSGNSSPGSVPAKRKYIYEDLARLSEYYGINFAMPKDAKHVIYTKGSMPAMKLMCALQLHHPHFVDSVSRNLFKRVWVNDEDIATTESLRQSLLVSDFPAESIPALIKSIEVEDWDAVVTEQAAKAVENGLFGLPSFTYDTPNGTQLLFGTDRIFILAKYLGHSWPLA